MKIILIKTNFLLLIILYISYLINNYNTSHLRSKLTFKSKMRSKSHLFPSTTENCGILCLECSQNDLQSCITCQPGIFEYKNKCYNNCPENTFADEEWQICRECDSTCPVCWGPSSDMCGTHKGTKTKAVLLEDEIKQFFLKKKFENYEKIKLKQKEEFENENYLENNNNNNNGHNLSNYLNKTIRDFKDKQNQKRNNNEFYQGNLKEESERSLFYNNAWLNKINVILKDVDKENIYPINHRNKIQFNTNTDRNNNNNNRNEIDSATISMEDVYGSNKILAELPVGSFTRKDGIFIPIPSYLDENMEIIESHWIFVKGAWLGNKWMKDWVPVLPSFISHFGEKNKMYYENGGYWIFDNNKGIYF